VQLIPSQIDQLSGIAQCLDDQWAPAHIVDRATAKKLPLSHYASEIQHATKTEFFKSLLTMRSVVVNRAYLLHNETIKQLYLGDGLDAETFARFMDDRTIIPFLYDERELSHFAGAKLLPDVEKYWTAAEASKINKLRLSWDEAKNKVMIETHIAKRYGDFFRTIDGLNIDLLRNDFSLHSHDNATIRKLLRQMRDFANHVMDETDRPVKRKEIYRRFICLDDVPEDVLIFDPEKPLGKQIKALAD
jgi:hypothetical protein